MGEPIKVKSNDQESGLNIFQEINIQLNQKKKMLLYLKQVIFRALSVKELILKKWKKFLLNGS